MKCTRCESTAPADSLVCLDCGGIQMESVAQIGEIDVLEASPELRAIALRAEIEAATEWFKEFGRNGILIPVNAAAPDSMPIPLHTVAAADKKAA